MRPGEAKSFSWIPTKSLGHPNTSSDFFFSFFLQVFFFFLPLGVTSQALSGIRRCRPVGRRGRLCALVPKSGEGCGQLAPGPELQAGTE